MSNILRCSCGLVVRVGEDIAPHRRLCSQCGQLLPPAALARGTASDALGTVEPIASERGSGGTVQLQPYYALEDPPMIGYRVVELREPTLEGHHPHPAIEKPTYPVATALKPSRWADSDIGDLDVRAILAKAKQELRNERRKRPRSWPLEKSGGQCLRYPLRVCWKLARLALVWTFITVVLGNVLVGPAGPEVWLARLPILIVPLYLVGVTWNFLRQVLRLAVVGDSKRVPVPSYRSALANVHCALMAGGAFLAGPIFVLAAGVWFWLHAGTLELLDRLLLWQLWLCAGVGWVYLLLAVDARGRFRDAQAAAVEPLVRREGWPALVFPILGGASVTVFVHLSVKIWALSFDEGFQALLLQFLLWCAGLFLWTFLLRWYGMTRYWRRQVGAQGDFESAA